MKKMLLILMSILFLSTTLTACETTLGVTGDTPKIGFLTNVGSSTAVYD